MKNTYLNDSIQARTRFSHVLHAPQQWYHRLPSQPSTSVQVASRPLQVCYCLHADSAHDRAVVRHRLLRWATGQTS